MTVTPQSMSTLLMRYAAGLVAGSLLVLWLTSRGTSAATIWDAGTQAELHVNRAWLPRRDSLRAIAARDSLSADSAARKVTTLWSLIDAFHRPSADSTAPDTGAVGQLRSWCDTALRACKAEGDLWRSADDADRTRADSAERQLAVTDSLLRAGLRVHACRIVGLLPCPSRDLMLVVGAGLGYLGGRHF